MILYKFTPSCSTAFREIFDGQLKVLYFPKVHYCNYSFTIYLLLNYMYRSLSTNFFYKIMQNNNQNKLHGDSKNQCVELVKKSKEEVQSWLKSFDTVLTDCDGVLWLYNKAITGSCETITKFQESGKKVYLVTNNSTKTREEFLTKAKGFGYNVKLDEIKCTAHAAAEYLKKLNFNKKVYIIGSYGIAKELDAIGIKHNEISPDIMDNTLVEFIKNNELRDSSVGAVIVGFDEHFSFAKMLRAASYLENVDCLFIGTNTDERFPMPGYVIPGTGSIVKAVETCAERPATIMGKPSPLLCESLLQEKLIDPKRTLMIGDRSNTDIIFGKNCGFQTLLVGSGIHSLTDVKKWSESCNQDDKNLIPDYYLPSLCDLLQFF